MARIETRVTKMLGIKYPIIMGGMTGVGTPELAAAVSNAGGLGVFAAHNAGTPEKCREWIQHIRTLTDKPFGVNLTILPTMGPPPPYEEFAEVIIQSGVKIIETAGSNPKKWIPLFKNAGLTTIHKCVTIRHALSAEKLGVDIISLDGFECAGKKSFLFFILIFELFILLEIVKKVTLEKRMLVTLFFKPEELKHFRFHLFAVEVLEMVINLLLPSHLELME